MLPAVRGPLSVARHIVAYTWLMVAATLALIVVAPMGWIYSIGAVVLGVTFAVQAYRLWAGIRSDRRDPNLADGDYSEASLKRAMQLFHGSISYLAVIFLLVGLDPFVV